MSHYTTLDTTIVSTEFLVQALADMGFAEVEVHEAAQPLVGWRGDLRENQAEVIVRRRHLGRSSNDIGFARNAEGRFEALISEFDRGRYDQGWLGKLTQRYAYRVARDSLAKQDFALVEESMDDDRTIRMTVRRMA
jgi:hypothetical protein